MPGGYYFADFGADTVDPSSKVSSSGVYKVQAVKNGCYSELDSTTAVVNPSVTPSVQVSVNPGISLGIWVEVTFAAALQANEGPNPQYQWTKNGNDIPGATGPTYTDSTAIGLQEGDQVCVKMKSSAPCPTPAEVTACATITLDIKNKDQRNNIGLYPNPNDGRFSIRTRIKEGSVSIINAMGQTVYRSTTIPNTYNLQLPNGVYTMQVKTDDGVKSLRFVVSK